MSEREQVWDLGNLDEATPARRPVATSNVRRAATSHPLHRRRVDWLAAAAVPLPGAPLAIRGRTSEGLLFAAGLGLVASLSWAILGTIDRTGATMEWLGLPSASPVWSLGGLFGVAAALHVASVAWTPTRGDHAPPPPVSALASAAVPGWGQLLNGDRGRASWFLAGAWVAAFSWILASPEVGDLLAGQGLVLPAALETLSGAPFRTGWACALWSVAVYDAAQRAAWIRS